MNTPRLPDWQLRFAAFVAARQAQPFAWGVNDCALFAADGVEALTGVRLLPELRSHTSARGALSTLRAAGGLAAIATRALGSARPPLIAAVGDVVLVATGKRQALALCNGTSAIGPGTFGVVGLPMSDAVCAWRVG